MRRLKHFRERGNTSRRRRKDTSLKREGKVTATSKCFISLRGKDSAETFKKKHHPFAPPLTHYSAVAPLDQTLQGCNNPIIKVYENNFKTLTLFHTWHKVYAFFQCRIEVSLARQAREMRIKTCLRI